MFQANVVEKIKTHFVFSNFFFSLTVPFVRKCGKIYRAEQATDDNMAHAHSMLDNYGYKDTLSDCVILFAFPLQQWLHERPSMLRSTYVQWLSCHSRTKHVRLWLPYRPKSFPGFSKTPLVVQDSRLLQHLLWSCYVFWYVTPCRLVNRYRPFEASCCSLPGLPWTQMQPTSPKHMYHDVTVSYIFRTRNSWLRVVSAVMPPVT